MEESRNDDKILNSSSKRQRTTYGVCGCTNVACKHAGPCKEKKGRRDLNFCTRCVFPCQFVREDGTKCGLASRLKNGVGELFGKQFCADHFNPSNIKIRDNIKVQNKLKSVSQSVIEEPAGSPRIDLLETRCELANGHVNNLLEIDDPIIFPVKSIEIRVRYLEDKITELENRINDLEYREYEDINDILQDFDFDLVELPSVPAAEPLPSVLAAEPLPFVLAAEPLPSVPAAEPLPSVPAAEPLPSTCG